MLSEYNLHDQQILLKFKDHIFSGFIVTRVKVDSYFMAQDLAIGKEYKVRENQATHTLKEGDYIVGRIVPYETDYTLSIINLNYPKESSYTLKRLWRNIPSKVAREFTPLMIEKEIFQKNYQEMNQENNSLQSISPRDEFQGKSPQEMDPQEMDPQEMGPQERELSRDLINYVLTRIQSLKFSD